MKTLLLASVMIFGVVANPVINLNTLDFNASDVTHFNLTGGSPLIFSLLNAHVK